MEFNHLEDYKKMFQKAKEKYKKEIELLYALEFDFIPKFMDKQILKSKEYDYLIGSIHFDDKEILEQYNISEKEFNNPKKIDYIWRKYFEKIEEMAKSGYFNIVGHFDLIKNLTQTQSKKDIRLLAKSALKTIKKSGMSIEINTSGLRYEYKEMFPSVLLLEEICSYDIPITFGSDSHNPNHVAYKLETAEKLAKDIGFSHCVYYKQKDMIKTKIK